mgnify:FL=1
MGLERGAVCRLELDIAQLSVAELVDRARWMRETAAQRDGGRGGGGGGGGGGGDASFNNVDISGNLKVQNTNMIQTFELTDYPIPTHSYYIADISSTAITTGYFMIQIKNELPGSIIDPLLDPPEDADTLPINPSDYNQTIHFLAGVIDTKKPFIKVLSNIKKNPNTGIINLKINEDSTNGNYYLCVEFYNDPLLFQSGGGSNINDGNINDGNINDGNINDGTTIIDDGTTIIDDGTTIIDDEKTIIDDEKTIIDDSIIDDGNIIIDDSKIDKIGTDFGLIDEIGIDFGLRSHNFNQPTNRPIIDYIKVTLVNNHNNYNDQSSFGILNWDLTNEFVELPLNTNEIVSIDLSLNNGDPYGITSQPEYFNDNIIFHPENGSIKAGEEGKGNIDICGNIFVSGDASFNQNVLIRNSLTINNDTTVNNNLYTTGGSLLEYKQYTNFPCDTATDSQMTTGKWETIATIPAISALNTQNDTRCAFCELEIHDRSNLNTQYRFQDSFSVIINFTGFGLNNRRINLTLKSNTPDRNNPTGTSTGNYGYISAIRVQTGKESLGGASGAAHPQRSGALGGA